MVYIYNEILLSHKKNEILLFVATWMALENIMLSEISQIERQGLCNITYMWTRKIIQMNLYTKQKQTHRHRKQTYVYQRGDGRGGTNWEYGIKRYKLLYIK